MKLIQKQNMMNSGKVCVRIILIYIYTVYNLTSPYENNGLTQEIHRQVGGTTFVMQDCVMCYHGVQ